MGKYYKWIGLTIMVVSTLRMMHKLFFADVPTQYYFGQLAGNLVMLGLGFLLFLYGRKKAGH